jgi:hypothetical protein
MAIPENWIGFTDDIPLTPDDVTPEILDRLHSGVDEGRVLSWALARDVVRTPLRRPAKYADLSIDADLFEEIMR